MAAKNDPVVISDDSEGENSNGNDAVMATEPNFRPALESQLSVILTDSQGRPEPPGVETIDLSESPPICSFDERTSVDSDVTDHEGVAGAATQSPSGDMNNINSRQPAAATADDHPSVVQQTVLVMESQSSSLPPTAAQNTSTSAPSTSQRILVPVDANVLNQVIKLAAYSCELLMPSAGDRNKHENMLHKLLTSSGDLPEVWSSSGGRRSEQSQTNPSNNLMTLNFESCSSVSVCNEGNVEVVETNSTPHVVQMAESDEQFVESQTPCRKKLQLNRQAHSSTRTAETHSSSQTPDNSEHTFSHDATLTQELLESLEGFKNETETRVLQRTLNPLPGNSDDSSDFEEPPKKMAKLRTTGNASEKSVAQQQGVLRRRPMNQVTGSPVGVNVQQRIPSSSVTMCTSPSGEITMYASGWYCHTPCSSFC